MGSQTTSTYARKAFRAAAAAVNLWRLAARVSLQRAQPPPSVRRLLILGYAAIGDLIYHLPALRALRAGLAGARICFVANRHPGSEELLPATGLIDETWFYEYGEQLRGTDLDELAARVSAADFDAVLVSQGTPLRAFAPVIARIPIRIGHCRPLAAPREGWSAARYALWRLRRGFVSEEFERRLAFNRPVWVSEDGEHAVSRNLRLVAALGLPIPEDPRSRPDIHIPEEAFRLIRQLLPQERGIRTVGLHIGSPRSQYRKIWPAARWGEVCGRLAALYRIRFLLVGGMDERPASEEFLTALGGPAINLVGRLRLLETFAAMRSCDLFLGNDTGMTKASMALSVPTLTVWGPSDRTGYGIFWEPEKHAEVFLELPCSPCVRMGLQAEGSGVINFSNCGHRRCLADLHPETVVSAVQRRFGRLLGG